MSQLENIEAIEKTERGGCFTNSNYASNEIWAPAGLVFLRHAYSRYLAVKDEIIAAPTRGGKPELTKGFQQKPIYTKAHLIIWWLERQDDQLKPLLMQWNY